jgi:GAF domain-containing protein
MPGDTTHKIYSRTIVERVIKEAKPLMMLDTLSEDEADRSKSMELMRVRSVMCVPLISRSQIRGVIYVDSVNRPHGFRNDDLSLLTALSSSAAIAIENALLYAKEKTGTLH